jgi:hypothetical protein
MGSARGGEFIAGVCVEDFEFPGSVRGKSLMGIKVSVCFFLPVFWLSA